VWSANCIKIVQHHGAETAADDRLQGEDAQDGAGKDENVALF